MRLLQRLRPHDRAFDVVEFAIKIELVLAGPQPFDDLDPFRRHVVAGVMFEQRRAEHLDFRPVPTGDDVEHEAAAADMIDGAGLLGGHHRMHRRHMRGGEDGGIFGQRGHGGGPGEALEPFAVEIRAAAEALPAPDRNDGFEFHLVRHHRNRRGARPLRFQNAVDRRHGGAAGKIAAEVPSFSLRSLKSGLLASRNRSALFRMSMRFPPRLCFSVFLLH